MNRAAADSSSLNVEMGNVVFIALLLVLLMNFWCKGSGSANNSGEIINKIWWNYYQLPISSGFFLFLAGKMPTSLVAVKTDEGILSGMLLNDIL